MKLPLHAPYMQPNVEIEQNLVAAAQVCGNVDLLALLEHVHVLHRLAGRDGQVRVRLQHLQLLGYLHRSRGTLLLKRLALSISKKHVDMRTIQRDATSVQVLYILQTTIIHRRRAHLVTGRCGLQCALPDRTLALGPRCGLCHGCDGGSVSSGLREGQWTRSKLFSGHGGILALAPIQ